MFPGTNSNLPAWETGHPSLFSWSVDHFDRFWSHFPYTVVVSFPWLQACSGSIGCIWLVSSPYTPRFLARFRARPSLIRLTILILRCMKQVRISISSWYWLLPSRLRWLALCWLKQWGPEHGVSREGQELLAPLFWLSLINCPNIILGRPSGIPSYMLLHLSISSSHSPDIIAIRTQPRLSFINFINWSIQWLIHACWDLKATIVTLSIRGVKIYFNWLSNWFLLHFWLIDKFKNLKQ